MAKPEEWQDDALQDTMLQGERLVWRTRIKTYTQREEQYNTPWKDRNVYFTTARVLWELGSIPKEIRYTEISAVAQRPPGSGGMAGVGAVTGMGGVIHLRSTRAVASFQFQDKRSLDFANWLVNEGMRGADLQTAEGIPALEGRRDPNAPPPAPPPAEKAGGCFIATAAYGTSAAPDVALLRHYRDSVLVKTAVGRRIIASYETLSPPLARRIHPESHSGAFVRACLKPIVAAIRHRRGSQGDA